MFTVASNARGKTVAADPTSIFDLSDLAMALPFTPPRALGKYRSVENVGSTQRGSSPARVTPTTPPSWTEGLPATRRTNPHGYEDIDVIGYEGEQFCVELLKQYLPDFEENTHWTSKMRTYGGFGTYDSPEVTDLTYPDTQGLLSKLIFDRAEEGSVPDWLRAANIRGSRGPKYFLEVKTTTGALETPFIISRNQFKIVSDSFALHYNRSAVFLGIFADTKIS